MTTGAWVRWGAQGCEGWKGCEGWVLQVGEVWGLDLRGIDWQRQRWCHHRSHLCLYSLRWQPALVPAVLSEVRSVRKESDAGVRDSSEEKEEESRAGGLGSGGRQVVISCDTNGAPCRGALEWCAGDGEARVAQE